MFEPGLRYQILVKIIILTKNMLTLTVSFPGRHPAGQTGIDLKRKKSYHYGG